MQYIYILKSELIDCEVKASLNTVWELCPLENSFKSPPACSRYTHLKFKHSSENGQFPPQKRPPLCWVSISAQFFPLQALLDT